MKAVSSLKKFYSIPRDTDEDILDGHILFVDTDPQHSYGILSKYYEHKADNERRCLDVGAGIGRTSAFLCEFFKEMEMLEPSDMYRQRAIQRM